MKSIYFELIERVVGLFSVHPEVKAIALSGSLGSDQNDSASDIDLYVYTDEISIYKLAWR
jgi:predicted nucleotidyltransferase